MSGWKVAIWDGEDWPDKRWSVNDDGRCVCISPRYADIQETLPDAYKLASAEEMYAMLESLTDYDECQMFKGSINKLLAKARGEQ